VGSEGLVNGVRRLCADSKNEAFHFRFGSEADIEGSSHNARFTPESGHHLGALGCPVCAKSGHAGYFGSR
jgi:hypothetical protein